MQYQMQEQDDSENQIQSSNKTEFFVLFFVTIVMVSLFLKILFF